MRRLVKLELVVNGESESVLIGNCNEENITLSTNINWTEIIGEFSTTFGNHPLSQKQTELMNYANQRYKEFQINYEVKGK